MLTVQGLSLDIFGILRVTATRDVCCGFSPKGIGLVGGWCAIFHGMPWLGHLVDGLW